MTASHLFEKLLIFSQSIGYTVVAQDAVGGEDSLPPEQFMVVGPNGERHTVTVIDG